MRRVLTCVLAAASLLALAGCSTAVRGLASPAGTPGAAAPSAAPSSRSLPGGAGPTCFVEDGCDGATPSPTAADPVCEPLAAARSSFDVAARRVLRGSTSAEPATAAEQSALTGLVTGVVDACGFPTMVEVAEQYPDPLRGWLRSTAVAALGEVSALPGGLRCADLEAMGLGPQQAVDYWFLWDRPALMDADSDGIPCETVWPDVARYMPSN